MAGKFSFLRFGIIPDRRGARQVQNDIRGIRGQAAKLNTGLGVLGGSLSQMGRLAALGGTAFAGLGAAMVGIKAARLAVEFDSSLTKINTLVGISRDQVDGWREDIQSLSVEAGRPLTELSNALFVVTSAGARGEEAMSILERSAKAAAVGLGETETIARAVTSAVQAYAEMGLTASQATDILVATVREGNLEASDLAGSLGRVIGVAGQMGVSFGEVGAFIATFTRLGVDAEESVTALRGTLTALLGPTEQQEEALNSVGYSMQSLRDAIQRDGLAKALSDLVAAADGNVDALAAVIPNVRALGGVLGTAGAQAEEFKRIEESITGATGDLNTAFEGISDDPQQVFNEAKAAGQSLLLTIGEGLVPGVKDLTVAMTALAADDRIVSFFRLIGDLVGGLAGTLASITGSLGKLRAEAELNDLLKQVSLQDQVNQEYRQFLLLKEEAADEDRERLLALERAVEQERKLSLASISGTNERIKKLLEEAQYREDGTTHNQAAIDAENAKLKEQRAGLHSLNQSWRLLQKTIGATGREIAEVAGGGDAGGPLGGVGDSADEAAKRVEELRKRLEKMRKEHERAQARLFANERRFADDRGAGLADLARQINELRQLTDAANQSEEAQKRLNDQFDLAALLYRENVRDGEPLADLYRMMFSELIELQETQAQQDHLRYLEDSQKALENEAKAIEDSGLKFRLFGTYTREAAKELHIQTRLLEAGAEAGTEFAAAIREAAAAEFELADSMDATRSLASQVQDLSYVFADLFAGLDDGIANSLNRLGDLMGSLQNLNRTNGGVGGAIAGAQFGGDFAAFTQSLGIFKGDRGIGKFGGQLSGDYSSTGGQIGGLIGGAFGPLGGLIGGTLGTVVGGLIKKGADEALATVEQVGNEQVARVTKEEGGLKGVIGKVANAITDTISGIETLIGTQITGVDFGLKIRDDVVSVFINGITKRFDEIEEAVAFAVSQLLETADLTGASETAKTILRGIGDSGDPEELERALAAIEAIEALTVGPAVLGVREFFGNLHQLMQDAAEFGLDTAAQLEFLSAALTGQRNELLGVQDTGHGDQLLALAEFNTQMQSLVSGITAANQAVSAQTEGGGGLLGEDGFLARLPEEVGQAAERMGISVEELAANTDNLEELLASLPEKIDLAAAAERLIADFGGAGVLGVMESIHESAASLSDAVIALGLDSKTTARLLDEIAAAESRRLEQLNVSALDGLLALMNQAGIMEAERGKIAAEVAQKKFRLELAIVEAQLAAFNLIDNFIRGILNSLGEFAENVGNFAANIGGEISVPRIGGGRRRGGSGRDREAERESIRDFLRTFELDQFSLSLEELRDRFAEVREDARRLGISLERVAAAEAEAERRLREDFLRTLERFEQPTIGRGLAEINRQFAELREGAEAFGISIARVNAAHQQAIEDFYDSIFGRLEEQQERLLLGGQSPLAPEQQLAEAQAQFQDAIARALAGDIGAIDEVADLQNILLGLGQNFLGSGGYGNLFEWVNSQVERVLGLRGGKDSLSDRNSDPVAVEVRKAGLSAARQGNQMIELLSQLVVLNGGQLAEAARTNEALEFNARASGKKIAPTASSYTGHARLSAVAQDRLVEVRR